MAAVRRYRKHLPTSGALTEVGVAACGESPCTSPQATGVSLSSTRSDGECLHPEG